MSARDDNDYGAAHQVQLGDHSGGVRTVEQAGYQRQEEPLATPDTPIRRPPPGDVEPAF